MGRTPALIISGTVIGVCLAIGAVLWPIVFVAEKTNELGCDAYEIWRQARRGRK